MIGMSEHTIDQHSSNDNVKKKHRVEGPRNHFLTFALSIVLTGIAFLAVAYSVGEDTHVEPWFVQIFIVTLAIFQAVIQLGFWMHLKDKGHAFPIIGIAFGFIVALTAAAAGLLWSWW